MKMKSIMTTMLIALAPAAVAAQTATGEGILTDNLDTTVNPGDDFYEFACGGWVTRHPLPPAFSRYGSFDTIEEENNKRINGILTELTEGTYTDGTVEQKLRDFYALAMDSTRRNAEGTSPLMPLINEMESARTTAELQAVQLKHAAFAYGVPLSIYFDADAKNAAMNIIYVNQGGLTLGLKDYYLDNDKATVDIREAFKKHIVRMFRLFGFKKSDAEKKMNAVITFETALAQISKSRTELRDPQANYNKTTLADFRENYPNIHFEELLNAEGVSSEFLQEIVVGQPAFLEGADRLIAELTVDDLRAYMEWDAITGAASYLSDETEEASFDFFGRTMRGRKENFPRQRRCTDQAERFMGEALGRLYTERYFPASSKERMQRLVENLQVSLAERILAQDWMSVPTKMAALKKLSTFYVKIGYPDKWKDMSGLVIDPEKSYYDNVMACREYWNKYNIKRKAGQPVDRDEWYMTPQTVNAYYNPSTNEICFPAGILQYPFFDPAADDAFNYGAIGVVIGHEMTHGFDDQGRQFDCDGNLVDWWTKADGDNFTARTDKYADFFSNIKVLPDLNANGRLTLGENLADHGGLQVAFNAYKHAAAEQKHTEETEPAGANDADETAETKGRRQSAASIYTPEQRFFIAYAGVWANNITEKEIRSRTKSDPHALGRWRVNGALPHIDAWYEAFGVKEGDKMFIPADERLKLW